MTEPLRACGCGKVPSELHGTYVSQWDMELVDGDCCGRWFAKAIGDETRTEAWNAAPRGERVCVWVKDSDDCYTTQCADEHYEHDYPVKLMKFCCYCGGRIQVKEKVK